MVLLFQAQLFVVVANFVLCLLCLIVVSVNNVVNCIKITKQKSVNVAIISIYLGIVFFHVIPEGVQQLIQINHIVLQHIAGICLAIGFMGRMFVYRRVLIPTRPQNTTKSHQSQSQYTNSVMMPHFKYAQYYDPSTVHNREMEHTGSLTIDPSVYYPQYEWNVPGLHYHPVYSVIHLRRDSSPPEIQYFFL